MTDIIETIDRLHAEATPGPWEWSDAHDDRDGGRTWSLIGSGGYGILSCDGEWNSPQRCNPNDADLIAVLRNNWPALRDRLQEAERYKADSADRLAQMVDERSRLERRLALAEKALEVKEQLNATLRRCCDEAKAKERAFDMIANRSVGIASESDSDDLVRWKAWSFSPLTASRIADGSDLLTAIEAATREAKP